MNFNPPDPQSGQNFEDYFTVEYVKALNAAVAKALQGGFISGGPGITVTKVAGGITIKSSARSGGGSVAVAEDELPPIPATGLWVLTSNNGELQWRETQSC